MDEIKRKEFGEKILNEVLDMFKEGMIHKKAKMVVEHSHKYIIEIQAEHPTRKGRPLKIIFEYPI